MAVRRATVRLLVVVLAVGASLVALTFVGGRVVFGAAGPAPPDQARGAPPRATPFLNAAPTRGAVVGDVLDAASGRGVASAVVTIRGARGGSTERRLTDDRGRYYFTGLPTGQYVVSATRQGYLEGLYGRLRPSGEGLEIPVTAGLVTGGARIDLWRPGSVSGAVIDELGEPVTDVTVRAYRRVVTAGRVKHVAAAADVTDDRGMFRIAGLIPGAHVVMASLTGVGAPTAVMDAVSQTGSVTAELSLLFRMSGAMGARSGPAPEVNFDPAGEHFTWPRPEPAAARGEARPRVYPSAFYPGVSTTSRAGLVNVEPGRDSSGVTFQLTPVETGDISGAVVGPAGPVDRLLLRLLPDTETSVELGFETAMTISGSDGTFVFRGVPEGSYVIEGRSGANLLRATSTDQLALVAPAPAPARPAETDRRPLAGRDTLWVRTNVRVDSGAAGSLVLVAEPGESVSGEVTFEGRGGGPGNEAFASMVIELEPDADGAPAVPRAHVDAQGRFTIHGVLPGRYYVRPGDGPAGWQVAAVDGGGRDLSESALEIGDGRAPLVVVRYSTDTARVTGVVLDEAGRPATNATVLAFPARLPLRGRPNPLRMRSARVNTAGGFSIEGLPAGSYVIRAVAEADAGDWQDLRVLEGLRAGATAVTVRRNGASPVALRFVERR